MGADVLRLWIASTDYRNEMSVSDEILKRNGDVLSPHPQHRALPARQSARLRSGARPRVAGRDGRARPLDRASRASKCRQKIVDAYARYDFAEIVQALGQLLQRRPRRVVPRRHQGPPVHAARGFARRAVRRSRRCTASRKPSCAGSRRSSSSPPTRCGRRPARASARATCCSRRGTTGSRRSTRTRCCRVEDMDRLLALRDDVAQGARTDARQRRDRRRAGSRDRLALRRRRPELARAARRRAALPADQRRRAPGRRRQRARDRRDRAHRRRRPSACVAGSIAPMSARSPRIRSCAGAASRTSKAPAKRRMFF